MPDPPPPAGSCDCQLHIYANAQRYPARPTAPYQPLDATFDDVRRVHKAMNFSRGVIVHSAIYGSDHSLLLDALEGLPPEERKNWRGTANLDDSVSDAEIERLTKAGVTAARINFVKYLHATPDGKSVERVFDRLREIGWHARLHVVASDLVEHRRFLAGIKDVPMMIEHMGHVDFDQGLEQPAAQFILEMLRHENWWLLASNGNRDSVQDAMWDDALPYGRAFIAAAPDRTIWGTDWPHPMWHKRMMNDAEEVELLYRYVDYDKDLIRKILVDNPAKLYGFEG
jgi:predicted TIM-barrel fold metal-dependent hydrolase